MDDGKNKGAAAPWDASVRQRCFQVWKVRVDMSHARRRLPARHLEYFDNRILARNTVLFNRAAARQSACASS
ncbi:MAG: hypothetical protein JSS33_03570 [Proteobacteria bacterium]|nr:hypothetical protein [Pseudomonadota bacterium]